MKQPVVRTDQYWPTPSSLSWGVMLIAAFLGAFLRLDQFSAQVLIDDEWHAVHQVLRHGPAAMFLDFGFSDYSIPLGIYDWYVARWLGLSETSMRLPMLAAGLATVAALPLYVSRRLDLSTASVFALLVAVSPLLVIYSRMARPYALTLLLGWIAHAAFARFFAARRGATGAAFVYAATATFAVWLHPITGPFLVAPLFWASVQLRKMAPVERRAQLLRLVQLALPTGMVMALLLVPPLVANTSSLTLKSGVDIPDIGTVIGVWYAWLGTSSGVLVVVCLLLAAYGAPTVWRALPESRTGALGIVLTLLAIAVTRPMWSFVPLTMARYALPFLPLLLLAVAAGSLRLARRIASPQPASRRAAGIVVTLLPCAALAWESPLRALLQHPNTQTMHLAYHFDFRPESNIYARQMALIPLSSFWTQLSAAPKSSLRIAAAPFYFESYKWDAPRWERISGQTVLPGYFTGLCTDRRFGEVPRGPAFRFRNAVHLEDDAALARQRIDYVVWQRPYAWPDGRQWITVGVDTLHCEEALRTRYGMPVYEDSVLLAFRTPLVRSAFQ